jgi:hypothetical protein
MCNVPLDSLDKGRENIVNKFSLETLEATSSSIISMLDSVLPANIRNFEHHLDRSNICNLIAGEFVGN